MTSRAKGAVASLVIAHALAGLAAHAEEALPSKRVGAAGNARVGNSPFAPGADAFGPMPSPYDSRNVTFVYDPAKIYTLLAQAGQLLHVELAPDERIVTIQMSDAVRWTMSRVENPAIAPRIFFKPIQVGIATTASVVTSAGRKYELLLQSVPEGSYRYQRVSWSYPEVSAREESVRSALVEADKQERRRLAALEISPPFSLESLNWEYEIEGTGAFRPEAVFDDGRFTYIRLSASAQDWPAVFLLDGKQALLVDFVRRGPFLVIQRLVPALLLKLDEREVRISRRDARHAALWRWWK
ncbi:MAG TPA: TrbG/VirB9 family P-type conjugative transfer protein [Usitatibacter sp.]|nr:TrbG/VirB9 family P-type conjugative transfer protein [Usitatibacter sp.]